MCKFALKILKSESQLLLLFLYLQEDTINYLMLKAFETTAFLPFGYLVDQWRWDVFSGKIKPENYNKAWWDLRLEPYSLKKTSRLKNDSRISSFSIWFLFRCRIQGVSPPIVRSEKDFDPGAKYHIASDTPYIRFVFQYFLVSIILNETFLYTILFPIAFPFVGTF